MIVLALMPFNTGDTMIRVFYCALAAMLSALFLSSMAQATPSEIGVIVMHGKGGNPEKYVGKLAGKLEQAGFQVANLEMPWSGKRQYDVDMNSAANEITAALDAMRTKGAKKVFVSGHSQGGLFALLYGSRQPIDGLIAIAPGGSHGAKTFRDNLGSYVGKAKNLIDDGKGSELAVFADYEGSKGTFSITTTATNYFDWFNPDGPHNLDTAVSQVSAGMPVLYVAPTNDYPALKNAKQVSFNALPKHPLTRLYEPDSDHLNAPANAAEEIIRWINRVAGQ